MIVPVLDEASVIGAALDQLAEAGSWQEVIVVDGGSRDGTPGLARRHPVGARVCVEHGGRGRQLNAGAAAATGDVLLFLHADTRLPSTAGAELEAALLDRDLAGGNFDLRFDGGDLFSRVLAAWRRSERRLGVYYGDSAIFCRRWAFEALGGYRPLRVMEDYDFARRLERRFRTACLRGPVVTSARRWKARGVLRTFLTWNLIRWLFLAGMPEQRLARLYHRVR